MKNRHYHQDNQIEQQRHPYLSEGDEIAKDES
jgi:hypothetical protein